MADQQEKEQKEKQPDLMELYGKQGNEGQYGQGQYDSEGKPDPRGIQAQQINIDPAALKPEPGDQKNQDAQKQKSE